MLGKSTTHYRTINRGTSWQSFTVAAPPAVGVAPLAFHARKWDWILYMGTLCDGDGKGWGSACYDLVRRCQSQIRPDAADLRHARRLRLVADQDGREHVAMRVGAWGQELCAVGRG